jgi:hypothetical protein
LQDAAVTKHPASGSTLSEKECRDASREEYQGNAGAQDIIVGRGCGRGHGRERVSTSAGNVRTTRGGRAQSTSGLLWAAAQQPPSALLAMPVVVAVTVGNRSWKMLLTSSCDALLLLVSEASAADR